VRRPVPVEVSPGRPVDPGWAITDVGRCPTKPTLTPWSHDRSCQPGQHHPSGPPRSPPAAGLGNGRQYGEFGLAEYLTEETHDTSAVLKTWQAIDQNTVLPMDAIGMVFSGYGLDIKEELLGFAAANYRMTGPASFDGLGDPDVESVWGQTLEDSTDTKATRKKAASKATKTTAADSHAAAGTPVDTLFGTDVRTPANRKAKAGRKVSAAKKAAPKKSTRKPAPTAPRTRGSASVPAPKPVRADRAAIVATLRAAAQPQSAADLSRAVMGAVEALGRDQLPQRPQKPGEGGCCGGGGRGQQPLPLQGRADRTAGVLGGAGRRRGEVSPGAGDRRSGHEVPCRR